MSIYTKRWCDPGSPTDGLRILICRYRPRGLLKKNETWDIWLNQLAPSIKLHARAYGKKGYKVIGWEKYAQCYIKEMQNKTSQNLLFLLAYLVHLGRNITLLCSSACSNEERCHRSLMKQLIKEILDSGPFDNKVR